MPTIDQLVEWGKTEQRKGRGQCHTNHPVIMEDIRKESIKNTALRTRIGLETYCPRSYTAWSEMLEWLMERCGCNPLLVVDLIRLLVYEARRTKVSEVLDGIDMALQGLYAVNNYETELREARAAKKARRAKGA